MSTQLPAFTRRYGSKFTGTVVSDTIDTADMPAGVRYLVVYLQGMADNLQSFTVRVLGAQTGFEYLNSRDLKGRGSWVGNCVILPEIDNSYTIEMNIGDRVGTNTAASNDVVIRVAATNAETMPILDTSVQPYGAVFNAKQSTRATRRQLLVVGPSFGPSTFIDPGSNGRLVLYAGSIMLEGGSAHVARFIVDGQPDVWSMNVQPGSMATISWPGGLVLPRGAVVQFSTAAGTGNHWPQLFYDIEFGT